jgi:hypothetical protein
MSRWRWWAVYLEVALLSKSRNAFNNKYDISITPEILLGTLSREDKGQRTRAHATLLKNDCVSIAGTRLKGYRQLCDRGLLSDIYIKNTHALTTRISWKSA